MKKKLVVALLVSLLGIGLLATTSHAISIGLVGAYKVESNGSELQLNFEKLPGLLPTINYDGGVMSALPYGDPVIEGFMFPGFREYYSLPDLVFSDDAPVENPFDWEKSSHYKGFEMWKDIGTLGDESDDILLFTANITFLPLEVDGATGIINPDLGMNLTNIILGPVFGPQYANGDWGVSQAIDELLDPSIPAAITLTFNTADSDLEQTLVDGINNPAGWTNPTGATTYSATIVDAAATIHEPATMLLLGAGLFGLAGVIRRRKIK